mmetsp:Transcript_74530/g.210563  ORF Transcript_74530/g.210563 Transcript_74530/m.210563 type:complete len:225 (-) Transcript_74530:317-991(-)
MASSVRPFDPRPRAGLWHDGPDRPGWVRAEHDVELLHAGLPKRDLAVVAAVGGLLHLLQRGPSAPCARQADPAALVDVGVLDHRGLLPVHVWPAVAVAAVVVRGALVADGHAVVLAGGAVGDRHPTQPAHLALAPRAGHGDEIQLLHLHGPAARLLGPDQASGPDVGPRVRAPEAERVQGAYGMANGKVHQFDGEEAWETLGLNVGVQVPQVNVGRHCGVSDRH